MNQKIFTLDEANALLTEVVQPALDRIYANMSELAAARREGKIMELIVGSGADGNNPDRDSHTHAMERLAALQAEMRDDVEAIHSSGAVLKDLRHGLIDFPAVIDGQNAYLCWQRGESRIAYWHTLEGGFRMRRPIHGAEAGELDGGRGDELR